MESASEVRVVVDSNIENEGEFLYLALDKNEPLVGWHRDGDVFEVHTTRTIYLYSIRGSEYIQVTK